MRCSRRSLGAAAVHLDVKAAVVVLHLAGNVYRLAARHSLAISCFGGKEGQKKMGSKRNVEKKHVIVVCHQKVNFSFVNKKLRVG